METVLAILVGLLVSAGVYLFLRRHLLQLFFGFVLLSNAAILLVFVMGRLDSSLPPLIRAGAAAAGAPAMDVANPLSQAVILTAIVIGFGLQAFLLVLIYRSEKTLGTMDARELRIAEHQEDENATYPAPGSTESGPEDDG